MTIKLISNWYAGPVNIFTFLAALIGDHAMSDILLPTKQIWGFWKLSSNAFQKWPQMKHIVMIFFSQIYFYQIILTQDNSSACFTWDSRHVKVNISDHLYNWLDVGQIPAFLNFSYIYNDFIFDKMTKTFTLYGTLVNAIAADGLFFYITRSSLAMV